MYVKHSNQTTGVNMNFENLLPEEAAFIIRVLGQLPTESGAFNLHQKLVAQFTEQQKNQPTEE